MSLVAGTRGAVLFSAENVQQSGQLVLQWSLRGHYEIDPDDRSKRATGRDVDLRV